MSEEEFKELRQRAESLFGLGAESIHGPAHWRRVEEAVLLMAEANGADLVVGRMFAIFHDVCRWDDCGDLEHGPRAAEVLDQSDDLLAGLNERQKTLLLYAIEKHTAGLLSDDPTIGTCWDADRLDLGRVGIIPDAKWMSTAAGKEMADLGSRWLYMDQHGKLP